MFCQLGDQSLESLILHNIMADQLECSGITHGIVFGLHDTEEVGCLV